MVWCCAALVLAWVDFAVGATLSDTMLAPIINDFVIVNVQPLDCVACDELCSSFAMCTHDVPVGYVAVAEALHDIAFAHDVALLATMIMVSHGQTSKNHDGQTSNGCLPILQAY